MEEKITKVEKLVGLIFITIIEIRKCLTAAGSYAGCI